MLVKNICKSSDTEKYVYELKDNKYIETVFIKRRDGGTVCVSTQVGCPVGCIFCESGRNGFVRNLTSSEIVQQIILLRRKVNRIVFMGMGEPLFNYDNLIKQSIFSEIDMGSTFQPTALPYQQLVRSIN